MLTLVNEVLEMSRIESGKMELEPVRTDLSALISRAGDLIRPQMEEKEIAFTVENTIEDPWVLCDGNRLSRIFLNMLSNAYKFTPFERERTSTVSKTQGTGLGMAITKSIVDLMGGTITIDSKQGKGTEFVVTLPRVIIRRS